MPADWERRYIEKARRVLGYEPRIDLDEGFRRTEAWLREEGML